MTNVQTSKRRNVESTIIDALFTSGNGDRAHRLALISKDGRDLGGWGEPAVRGILDGVLNPPITNSAIPDKHSDAHRATLDRMEAQGGGFVRALAGAWRRADDANHANLYAVFEHYYRQYERREKAVDFSTLHGGDLFRFPGRGEVMLKLQYEIAAKTAVILDTGRAIEVKMPCAVVPLEATFIFDVIDPLPNTNPEPGPST